MGISICTGVNSCILFHKSLMATNWYRKILMVFTMGSCWLVVIFLLLFLVFKTWWLETNSSKRIFLYTVVSFICLSGVVLWSLSVRIWNGTFSWYIFWSDNSFLCLIKMLMYWLIWISIMHIEELISQCISLLSIYIKLIIDAHHLFIDSHWMCNSHIGS